GAGVYSYGAGTLLSTANPNLTAAINGAIIVNNGAGVNLTPAGQNAVVALVSHGPNLFGGYIYHASGQRFTLTGAGTREVENTDN
ncbi:hypothetical protein, partial [Parachitinimonas caeni]